MSERVDSTSEKGAISVGEPGEVVAGFLDGELLVHLAPAGVVHGVDGGA